MNFLYNSKNSIHCNSSVVKFNTLRLSCKKIKFIFIRYTTIIIYQEFCRLSRKGIEKMQFMEICQLYMREKKLQGVKTSTLSNYAYTMESLFSVALLKDLSENSLYDFIENLNFKFSRKTVIDKVNLLNDILKFAYEKGFIPNNIILPVPAPLRQKIQIFHEQDQQTLQIYLINKLDYFHFGILLTLFTGLRIGELSALKKGDIVQGVISIDKSMQRIKNFNHKIPSKTRLIIDRPKTEHSIRKIPMIEGLHPFFEELYSPLPSDSYVLTGTTSYIEPRTIERRYKKILEETEITYKVFHTLRHTFATNCIKSGMDIKTLSEILGHASVKITLERYVHPDMEMKKQAIKKLDMLKRS